MEDKEKSNGWLAVTFAALIGLAAALVALALRVAQLRSRGDASPIAVSSGTMPGAPATLPRQPAPAPPQAASTRWTTPTKYIMGVVLFLAILVALFIGRGVISMVLIAAILALFINPLIQRLHVRAHLKWGSAVALTYVLVILVLLLIPLLVFPNLLSALNYLFNLDYQQLASQLAGAIQQLSASLQANPTLAALVSPLLNSLATALQSFSVEQVGQPANVTVTLTDLTSQLASKLGADMAPQWGPHFGPVEEPPR